mmetsp:Transcript_3483/g.12488  ORF Transcript_3483/g.12488 Transcript_3483/m.12488 type:complete len:316 (-) Transcript_3483:700-1647(-)
MMPDPQSSRSASSFSSWNALSTMGNSPRRIELSPCEPPMRQGVELKVLAPAKVKLAKNVGRNGTLHLRKRRRMASSKAKKSLAARVMSPAGPTRHDKKPPQRESSRVKNVVKKRCVSDASIMSSVSIPKHLKVRMRSSCIGQISRHTDSETARASTSPCAPLSTLKCSRLSTSVEVSFLDSAIVLATMYPVLGCTIPAAPPSPSVCCGSFGRTLPMGMRQNSSSTIAFTSTPYDARRCERRSLRSSNGTLGRETRLVSSTKISVGLNGMQYRNVGSLSFRARASASRWSSRQSMKSISSSGNGWSSTSMRMPYAA